jgi:phenylpropionate dioxygenase-like ring-hydroxylating dioxygenase large terminal subunit
MVEEEEEEDGIASRVSYNWEDQWYPLYLTREVPRDAPLALQVFDKQLVLHYDGRGILRCYEDRCPHR